MNIRVAVAVAAVGVLAGCGAVDPQFSTSSSTASGPTAPATATATPGPVAAISASPGGNVLLSDNFSSAAGWGENDAANAHDSYTSGGGYRIEVKTGTAIELVYPHTEPHDPDNALVSVRASLPPANVGGGVFCRAQLGDSGNVGVDVLLVDASRATWEIDRATMRTASANTRTPLASGPLPSTPAPGPHTVTGRCQSGSDGTALELHLDGRVIGSATDTSALAAATGTSGVVAAADGAPGSVDFTDYQFVAGS